MCNRDVSPTLPSPALTLARRQDAVTRTSPLFVAVIVVVVVCGGDCGVLVFVLLMFFPPCRLRFDREKVYKPEVMLTNHYLVSGLNG